MMNDVNLERIPMTTKTGQRVFADNRMIAELQAKGWTMGHGDQAIPEPQKLNADPKGADKGVKDGGKELKKP